MDWEFQILDSIQKNLSGNIMNKLMCYVSTLGNCGTLWIILTIIMLFFKKTRKYSITCALSLIIMFLTCNVFIKNTVCRLRPIQIRKFVNLIVSPPSDYSYPSGHTFAAFAFATALLCCNKKLGIPAIIAACLMSFSRLYLYVHFPTDVFAGIVLGIITGILSYYIVDYKYKI